MLLASASRRTAALARHVAPRRWGDGDEQERDAARPRRSMLAQFASGAAVGAAASVVAPAAPLGERSGGGAVVDSLSVSQLRALLAEARVDTSDVFEKRELVERLASVAGRGQLPPGTAARLSSLLSSHGGGALADASPGGQTGVASALDGLFLDEANTVALFKVGARGGWATAAAAPRGLSRSS